MKNELDLDFVVIYQQIVNSISFPLVLLSEQLEILAINQNASNYFFNASKDEILDYSLKELHNGNIAIFKEKIRLILKKIKYEEINHEKNSHLKYIDVNPILSNSGKTYYTVGVRQFSFNDGNIALHINEIINHMPGSVYWKDREGRYLGCNLFVAKMAGLDSINDIIGKTDFDLCWREFAESWRKADEAVMRTEKPLEVEEQVRLSDGSKITELTYKAPLRNNQNEIVGIIGTSLNITEIKNLQSKLIAAKEEAEQANQEKSYVLSQITPELYLPFEFIEAAAHLVDIHARIQDRRDCLDRIIDLAREGKEMVKCAVDSAEITSKTAKSYSSSWFDLKILFESNLSRQMDWALKRNIHLVLDYPDNTPMWVNLPKYSISLILSNMLNVAISECSKERLEVKVNLVKKSVHDMDVEISLLPNGNPLDVEHTLFDTHALTDLKPAHEKQKHLILENIQALAHMLKCSLKVTEKKTEGVRFFLTLNAPIDTVHPYAQSPWKAFQPDTRVLIVDSEGKGDIIRAHLGEKNIDVILNHEDIKLKLLTAEKEGHPYHIVMIGRVGKGELQFSRASKLEAQMRKIRVKEKLMLVLIADESPSYNVGYDTVVYGQLLPTELQKELAVAYERWLDMPKAAN